MNAEKIVTDDSYLEQRKHGEASFPFRYYEEDVWQFDAHCINWHWHREIEMIFAARGDILCDVGADSFVLKEGCGLFVNSGVLHRYAAEGSVCMPNILFLPELLGEEGGRIYEKYVAPVIREGAEYLLLQPGEGGQNEPLSILFSVFEEQKHGADELAILQKLLALWRLLCNRLPRTRAQDGKTVRTMQLQQMMSFIHENFDKKIALQDIAASVYVGKNTALHIFRETIRISPVAYLIQYRLSRAAALLLAEDATVARIAEQTGFESSGYFCRKFKQMYGCSPTEYRSGARQQPSPPR